MDKQNPLLYRSTIKQASHPPEPTSTNWSIRPRKIIQESSSHKSPICPQSKTQKIILLSLPTQSCPLLSTAKPQTQIQTPNLYQDHHQFKFQLFHRHQATSAYQSSTSFLTSSPPHPYNTDCPFIYTLSLFPILIPIYLSLPMMMISIIVIDGQPHRQLHRRGVTHHLIRQPPRTQRHKTKTIEVRHHERNKKLRTNRINTQSSPTPTTPHPLPHRYNHQNTPRLHTKLTVLSINRQEIIRTLNRRSNTRHLGNKGTG